MRILLACVAGMSTSLVVSRMQEAAKQQSKEDYEIRATEVDGLRNELGHFDVCLLGPQVVYLKRRVSELVKNRAPVDVINPASYGRCDGAAVLKQAEDLYESWKGQQK